jgi:hypothetical protein
LQYAIGKAIGLLLSFRGEDGGGIKPISLFRRSNR